MTTLFAVSRDGTRIAYEVAGSGPAVVLLHGGGQSRQAWHDNGYVTRLHTDFTVITVDIRGHGESDRPAGVEAYTIDRISDDIAAVADGAQVNHFAVFGYSFGGNIARYLPACLDRVAKAVIVGIGFGAAAPPPFKDYALSLRAKWTPVIQAARDGTLPLDSLSAQDRAIWQAGGIPVTIDLLGAIVQWPPVEPKDLRCPTLWLVGTANDNAMASVKEYGDRLEGTKVVLQLLPGLTHADELTKVEDVLPAIRKFLQAPSKASR
jgi:pimeloyl-ACP methyl ester carboxylesterase